MNYDEREDADFWEVSSCTHQDYQTEDLYYIAEILRGRTC